MTERDAESGISRELWIGPRTRLMTWSRPEAPSGPVEQRAGTDTPALRSAPKLTVGQSLVGKLPPSPVAGLGVAQLDGQGGQPPPNLIRIVLASGS